MTHQRKELKGTFVPADFFVLRTPLLSFDELLAWSEGVEAPRARSKTEELDRAIAADEELLRSRLGAFAGRAPVREAIFLASPSLDESLGAWVEKPEGRRGQRIEQSLVRYFSRMAGRATPFGLFAACAVGGLGPASHLAVSPQEAAERHTRFDTHFLISLIDKLVRDPEVRSRVRYHVNSALYAAGGGVRYAEVRPAAGGSRNYSLVRVETSEHLDVALKAAGDGALAADIAAAIVAFDPAISQADAAAYVAELIHAQILEPELALKVTGTEPEADLIAQLRKFSMPELADRLEKGQATFREMDRQPFCTTPSIYRDLGESLEPLGVEVDLKRLCQVDLFRGGEAPLMGPELQAGFQEIVELFERLAPGGLQQPLARFRTAFVERYDQEEVALVEVLDEESGIGAKFAQTENAESSPLLDGLTFRGEGGGSTRAWANAEQHLLRRLTETLAARGQELILSDADIASLSRRPAAVLPDSFCVKATVAARSAAALDGGDFLLYPEYISGPSGANMLGRFCYGSPKLTESVREHLRGEEKLQPNAILAELVHLPEWNAANVILRPLLRGYEIPYLGRSGAPSENQIPVTDLWVSVKGERIVLRSRRLGREILPRLTCAHNFHMRSLALYRFLSLLQMQDSTEGPLWQWGAFESLPFLPRVRRGRVVVAPARWRVSAGDAGIGEESTRAERFSAIQRLRQSHGWPRFVATQDADNVLPIDLDNVLCVDTLAQMFKGRAHVDVVETIQPDDMCAQGPEGRFAHEILLPFLRTEAPARRPAPEVRSGAPAVAKGERSFPPGSEWLYVKLYMGSATVDRALTSVLAPVVRDALRTTAADRWFFVRYGDPDWHLRLRLHGSAARLNAEVLPMIHAAVAPLLSNGEIAKMQLDTYEREIERYGGLEATVLAEELFHIDSEAVLAVIGSVQGDMGARCQLALRGIDDWLSDLGLTLAEKHDYLQGWSAAQQRIFRADAAFLHQLAGKYRQQRHTMAEALGAEPGPESALHDGVLAFRERSRHLAPVLAKLRALQKEGRIAGSPRDLAASYVHMFTNRLLRGAGPQQEVVLYDYLSRYYESRLARVRAQGGVSRSLDHDEEVRTSEEPSHTRA